MSTKYDVNAIRKMVHDVYTSPFASEAVKFSARTSAKAFFSAVRTEKAISQAKEANPKLAQIFAMQMSVTIAQMDGAYRTLENAVNKVEKAAHKDNTAQAVKMASNLWKVEAREKRAQQVEISRANAEAKRVARANETRKAYERIMGK